MENVVFEQGPTGKVFYKFPPQGRVLKKEGEIIKDFFLSNSLIITLFKEYLVIFVIRSDWKKIYGHDMNGGFFFKS